VKNTPLKNTAPKLRASNPSKDDASLAKKKHKIGTQKSLARKKRSGPNQKR
jgi:hypothetical protein